MSVTAALLLALQTGAPGTLTFDVRCMIAAGRLARNENETLRHAGELASQYYFGRIDGRVTDAELEEAIWRETRDLRADQQSQLLRACGAYLEARGQRLTEVGNRISAREQGGTRR